MTLPPTQPCPYCEHPVRPGRKCWGCQRDDPLGENDRADADNLLPDDVRVSGESPRTASVPDSRSEARRKQDARNTVTMLGWDILDLEQGWRPFTCPKCDNPLPGGTRVSLGLADWCVMRAGVVAWIEWKTEDNVQTPAQQKFQKRCEAEGVPYAVCRNTAEAVAFLESLMRGRAA